MFLEDELHAAYKFGNAPILNFPFPHIFVENIFTEKFYSKIQDNLLDLKEMTSMADLYNDKNYYKERMVFDFAMEESIQKVSKDKRDFWLSFHKSMYQNLSHVLEVKFKKFLDMRFTYLENVSYTKRMQLVYDKKHYSLGPHTDHPSKVLSLLIYLPKDRSQISTGTSLYMPKDPELLDKELSHKHYPREDFLKVITMPYVPNSAFCFIKTNNSFHGVEALDMENTARWSIQYNLHVNEETFEKETIAKKKHQEKNNTEASSSKFSI
jgi:hypothetical protein|tara:strand:- start:433 stop:1233 length:801 start_codon:yes stop_codon:yes gene_type:complete